MHEDKQTAVEYGYPVHAGIDLQIIRWTDLDWWLPRTRGDRPVCSHSGTRRRLATPYTRGSTFQAHGLPLSQVGYPVHAGIDLRLTLALLSYIRLPRTRGDRPEWIHDKLIELEATPYTRGSTRFAK